VRCRLPDTPELIYRHSVAVDAAGRFRLVGEEPALTFDRYTERSLREVAKRDPDHLTWLARQAFLLPDARNITRAAMAAVALHPGS
jgi:hypothetical protein